MGELAMLKGIGKKVVWPALTLALVVYVVVTNTVKDKKIEDQQAQIEQLATQVTVVTAEQQELTRKAEEEAHAMRVSIAAINSMGGQMVGPERHGMESHTALQFESFTESMKFMEAQRLGKDKAKELWDKASEEASKKRLPGGGYLLGKGGEG
jgi:hypothetical protein